MVAVAGEESLPLKMLLNIPQTNTAGHTKQHIEQASPVKQIKKLNTNK